MTAARFRSRVAAKLTGMLLFLQVLPLRPEGGGEQRRDHHLLRQHCTAKLSI